MKYFKSLEGVYRYYGKENVIPVTNLKQILYYTKICDVQPVYVTESEQNEGKIVCFFAKEDTKECYEAWTQARPDKKDK